MLALRVLQIALNQNQNYQQFDDISYFYRKVADFALRLGFFEKIS
jgi:hypothetical protein